MLALYRCGCQSDALDVYQRLKRTPRQRAGRRLGPALQKLQRAVLEHATWRVPDPTGDAAQPSPPDAGGGDEDADFPLLLALTPAVRPPLVWAAPRPAGGSLLPTSEPLPARASSSSVRGEPGVGKTRLAMEVAPMRTPAGRSCSTDAAQRSCCCRTSPSWKRCTTTSAIAPRPCSTKVTLISGELRRIVPVGQRVSPP